MKTSPFSLSHDWSLGWNKLPLNFRPFNRVEILTVNEKKALESIASVGVIGGKQLSRLFLLEKKEIEAMVYTDKIVRHELTRNNNTVIPMYSLGPNGAKLIKLDVYEENYWLEYDIEAVLKQLLFFQLYHYFSTLKIMATPSPFTSAVESNDNLIYVYVMKDDIDDLMRYLKWEKRRDHRLIIVAESAKKINNLELHLKEMKLRVVIESDLIKQDMKDEDVFYSYLDGELVR